MKIPFFPHVLSGGNSLRQVGRGKETYLSSGLVQRSYTLWSLEEGAVQISIDAKKAERIEGPAALFLEPGHQYWVSTEPGTHSFWIEWGIQSSPLAYRSEKGEALRYKNRKEQPDMETFFGVNVPVQLPEALFSPSHRLCRKISGLWWRSQRDRLQAHHLLGEWVLDLVDHFSNTEHNPTLFPDVSLETRKLFALAEQQLNQHLTITSWAKLAGCHRNALNQRMIRETGLTAKEVLNQIRIEQACRQLRQGETVEFTSEWVGFQSRTAFSRWFKLETGSSPSQWQLINKV